jgi:hypothetical protein
MIFFPLLFVVVLVNQSEFECLELTIPSVFTVLIVTRKAPRPSFHQNFEYMLTLHV